MKNELYKEYIDWLKEKKKIGNKSAHDYVSRVKRAKLIESFERVNDLYIKNLEDNCEFISLSTSVKSQIRRSLRLYIEFLNNINN